MILRIQWEVMSLVEEMEVLDAFGQQNEHYCDWMLLWYKEFVSSRKMRTRFVSVKTSDPSDAKISCLSCHDLWQENMERTLYVAGRRDRNGNGR
jgi:hypothetical protein